MAGATDVVNGILQPAGLGDLGAWAWQRIKDGASEDEVLAELRQRPEYKARFPAMDALSKDGRAINEGSYMQYEQTIRELNQSYGMPGGLYDTPAFISKMLLSDVSPAEASDRFKIASSAAFQVPQEVRDSLQENYATGPGGMIAYFLDPDKAMPVLQNNFAAAQVQAASRMNRVGTSIQTAERLASAGASMDEALKGYAQVAALQGLTSGYGETVTQAQTEEAAFAEKLGGQNSTTALTRVQRSRQAAFAGGGGAQAGQAGVTGLGSASTT